MSYRAHVAFDGQGYEAPVYWAGTEKLTEREMKTMVKNYRDDGAVVVRDIDGYSVKLTDGEERFYMVIR